MYTKSIPVLFERKEECCACSACYSICPSKAIIMKFDDEGFEYPVIIEKKCFRCYRCQEICPIKKEKWNNLSKVK